MSAVVGIDANHDFVTGAATKHRKANVYPHFEANGFSVTRLARGSARRDNAEDAVLEADVVYITGVGHGEFDRYFGQDFETIFVVGGYDPVEVQGTIVHLLSCATANGLGGDFVANGARAFFGYSDNFAFDDESANASLSADSEIDRALAEGKTARVAFNRAVDAFEAGIEEARNKGQQWVAAQLENNLDALCGPSTSSSLGAKNAKLV